MTTEIAFIACSYEFINSDVFKKIKMFESIAIKSRLSKTKIVKKQVL